MVRMDTVCDIQAGGDVPDDMVESADAAHGIPVVGNGTGTNAICGYTGTSAVVSKLAVTVAARGSIGYAAFRDYAYTPIIRLLSAIPKDENQLDAKFLYYALEDRQYNIMPGGIPQFTIPEFARIRIPLPPLQIQREIVAILDKFDTYCNSITAGLAGELEMRRKQYRYWANALIMEGTVQMVKLGSLCKIHKGQQLNKDAYTDGVYPVWNMGAEPSGAHDTYNRDVPTIVIAGHGNSVGTVNWVDEPFWAGGGCYYLDGFAEDVNDRYLFHAMKVRERSLMGLASDGPIRHLYPKTIARAQVPVPVSASGTGAWDAARQQFICDILDKLCELARELERELELRRKQYEYYRDMLLAFPEKKGA